MISADYSAVESFIYDFDSMNIFFFFWVGIRAIWGFSTEYFYLYC